jgi:hypothetical protein
MFGEGREVRPLGIRHDLAPFARGSHSVGMSCSTSGGAVSAKRNLNRRTTVWARHSSPACIRRGRDSRSQHPAARYHTSDLLQSRVRRFWHIFALPNQGSPKSLHRSLASLGKILPVRDMNLRTGLPLSGHNPESGIRQIAVDLCGARHVRCVP